MAGVAGLGGDAGILDVADLDLGLPGRLHLVDQELARHLLVDGRITALVAPLVGIGHVAGGTAGAAEITALFPAGHADMAALALLAGIGDAGEIGMLRDLVDVDVADLLHLRGELIRMCGDHLGHVGDIVGAADRGLGPVLVGEIVIAPDRLVVALQTPGPEIALELAGLGVHERLGQTIGIAVMALTAGLLGNPYAAGIGIEHLRPPRFREIAGRTFMSGLRRRCSGIAAMADDATAGIAEIDAHQFDGFLHGAVGKTLDAFMTREATIGFGRGG